MERLAVEWSWEALVGAGEDRRVVSVVAVVGLQRELLVGAVVAV
jgi:hypothetical protein